MRGKALVVGAATLIAVGTTLALSLTSGEQRGHSASSAPTCVNRGANPDGSVRFSVPCPQSAVSADGRWKLVLTAPTGRKLIYDVVIKDADGKIVGQVPSLIDDMPFVLHWSPRSNWFLLNHYAGSGLERPRVFQITSSGVVEHTTHLATGLARARKIFPCLPDIMHMGDVTGFGIKWSKDGRHLAWEFLGPPDMCLSYTGVIPGPIPTDKKLRPFLMISDVESGAIVEDSVRLLPDDGRKWDFPVDGPYADF